MHAGETPEVDQILLGENLALLPRLADRCFQLVYIDPPFNTGRAQVRRTLAAVGAIAPNYCRASATTTPSATTWAFSSPG